MRKLFYRVALLPFTLLFALHAQAASWEIDQDMSNVYFHYSYEGDEYRGEFRNVQATFDIDPMQPGSCNFQVTIPINDVYVDNPDVMAYLLDIELFDVDRFPTATFQAENCKLQSTTSFIADGTLTIRDQTNPISFPFNMDIEMVDGQPRFHLTSEVTIQRLEYGVGQGYFANTASIPNDVRVEVDVYAVPQ